MVHNQGKDTKKPLNMLAVYYCKLLTFITIIQYTTSTWPTITHNCDVYNQTCGYVHVMVG